MTLKISGFHALSIFEYNKRSLFLTHVCTSSYKVAIFGELEESLWFLLVNLTNFTALCYKRITTYNTSSIGHLWIG